MILLFIMAPWLVGSYVAQVLYGGDFVVSSGVTRERRVTMTKYILMIIAIFMIAAGTASAATVYVPTTYPTIQAAVDSVGTGDTVYVYNGTYIENVTVKKGILLQGEGKNVVTIDGNGRTALDIRSSNVGISGFTITNSQDGIAMTISKNCTISGCDLHSNINGIHLLMSCNYNTISDCTMHSNSNCGIYFSKSCNYNTVSGCDTYSNTNGVYLSKSCNHNKINDCTMHLNSNCGIYLWRACRYNTICGCDVYSNEGTGILVFRSCDNNSITGCNAYLNDDSGIMLQGCCSGNTVENCNATSNIRNGIILFQASGGNLIRNCGAHSNLIDGIVLFQTSNGNMIQDCGAHSNSRTGIYITHASNGNTVTGCDARDNINGIHISHTSDGNTVSGCDAKDNNDGIILSHVSNGNMVADCNARSNLQRGVSITMNSKENEIASCFIDSAEYGVVMSRASTGNVVSDTIIRNISSRDFLLEYASSGSAIETPFETIGGGLSSMLTVRNYLDVKVMDGTIPVGGADVRVTDNGRMIYATSGYGGPDPCTDSTGLCSGILVTDRVYNHLSSTAAENTTLVSAKHSAWAETDRDVDMSESHTEEFSI